MAKKSVKTHEARALRMPGFNAEASLYDVSGQYSMAGTLPISTEGRVVPQGLWVNPVTHHLIYCDDTVGCIDLGYRGPIYKM
jgi:hypothetical protein